MAFDCKLVSGKKKRHTIKDLIVINGISGKVICIHEGKGSIHDFELFKQKGELTAEQKMFNRKLSSFTVFIEHVNRRIKRFKILQLRYRNKQRKHLLRVSLICGIYNYELEF